MTDGQIKAAYLAKFEDHRPGQETPFFGHYLDGWRDAEAAWQSERDRLRDALETAKNGLLWYQDRYPAEVNGCDDEAMAQIDAALGGTT